MDDEDEPLLRRIVPVAAAVAVPAVGTVGVWAGPLGREIAARGGTLVLTALVLLLLVAFLFCALGLLWAVDRFSTALRYLVRGRREPADGDARL
ncbi:hypothetical protein [Streptomyces sp. NBC_01216]|uniref:hypothetical protein n=1 Tax=unclassified Streptomyces TaxID=2593676 RepID=UPI002E0FC36A|nr:hypothetical protein OG393_32050 [Streptomyces sp. NBC_01216]